MARTNPKALNIGYTDEELGQSAALTRLKEKGHHVDSIYGTPMEWDVIIGPQCWRIDPQLRLGDDSTNEESLERQLEMMEKGVRAIKYPKKKGEEDAKTTTK